MASNNDPYQPWPRAGESFAIGCTTVLLAATAMAALAARLYVVLRHKGELSVLASTMSLCSSHIFMVTQSALVIAACYYGWGSAIETLPDHILHKAEIYFFTSNVLLILVHRCSRTTIALTLWRACDGTSSSKLAVSIFCAIPAWAIGSIFGVTLKRVPGRNFWLPIGADCSFTLWAVISLVGFGIDVAVAACAVTFIFPLQMALSKKVYTLFVFGVGIVVIVPTAYGLAHLYRFESQITYNPTFYSAPFIYANQAAIATSLWCRIWEAARKLQQDMSYGES